MKKIRNLLFLMSFMFFLFASPALAVDTYYADNSIADCAGSYNPTTRACSGGSDTSYNTIQEAIDAASTTGDIVNVRAGNIPNGHRRCRSPRAGPGSRGAAGLGRLPAGPYSSSENVANVCSVFSACSCCCSLKSWSETACSIAPPSFPVCSWRSAKSLW